MKKTFPFFCLLFSLTTFAQAPLAKWTGDAFRYRVFVENKGQFSEPGAQVLYGTADPGTKIFFSQNSLEYHIEKTDIDPVAYREFMDHELKEKTGAAPAKKENEAEAYKKMFVTTTEKVKIEWVGANLNAKLIPSGDDSERFFYGSGNGSLAENCRSYRKLTYKEIYPGIDIEYVFHPKEGIKYNIICRPGSDPSQVKMKYTGARHMKLDTDGNLLIRTALGYITDHAPVSYFENGEKVGSSFLLQANTISFRFHQPLTITHHPLIIDPWVINPAFTVNRVFDVETDAAGDAYVYGSMPFMLRKYTAAGTTPWTFASGMNGWPGSLEVDNAGNSYITDGSINGTIKKVSPAGAQLYSNNTNPQFEFFSMCFNPTQTVLVSAASYGFDKATTVNTANGNIGAIVQVTNFMGLEFRGICAAPNGNFYGLTVTYTNGMPSIVECFTPALVNLWNASSGYSPAEIDYNGINYKSININFSNPGSMNCIAASTCSLYTYNGKRIHRRSLSNGVATDSLVIANGLDQENGGILIDSCGYVYIGTQNGVEKYDAALNFITSAATTGAVYDIAFAPNNEIYAVGNGFVSSIAGLRAPCIMTANTSGTGANCGNPNGTASVSAVTGGTGPYTYTWSNGATSASLTGLTAGTYTVTVKDASCLQRTATATVQITGSTGTTTSANASTILCNGNTNGTATASVNGGTGPYTYSWSNGQTNSNATGLSAGNYTVVTTDANGCTSSKTVSITQPALLAVALTSSSLLCNGAGNGSASVTASGGTTAYTYSWSNGATTSNIQNLTFGIYTVTVSDANGCTSSQTVNITQPSAINLQTSSVNANCGQSNGSASLTSSGGTGTLTYSWNPGGQTSATATGLSSGSYTLTVTDGNGCTQTAAVTVTSNGGGTASITASTNVNCNGGSNGTATATITGGIGPYTYSWSNGATTSSIQNLTSNIYTVTITDANGCIAIQTVNITQPSAINLQASSSNANCGQNNGTASLTASGGTGPYTYSWSNNGTQSAISNLQAGIYTATITDSNGCTATATPTVTSNGGPTATATATATTVQSGTSTNLTGTGGVSYSWSPATGLSCTNCANPTASPAQTTVYCVTVTDTSGCTDQACVTITVETSCPGNIDMIVPTAFSPNGDGHNDEIVLHGWKQCVAQFIFIVYDRWGERVFESEDPGQKWDGTYRGKKLDPAVFAYYISATNLNGESFIKKGNITLLK